MSIDQQQFAVRVGRRRRLSSIDRSQAGGQTTPQDIDNIDPTVADEYEGEDDDWDEAASLVDLSSSQSSSYAGSALGDTSRGGGLGQVEPELLRIQQTTTSTTKQTNSQWDSQLHVYSEQGSGSNHSSGSGNDHAKSRGGNQPSAGYIQPLPNVAALDVQRGDVDLELQQQERWMTQISHEIEAAFDPTPLDHAIAVQAQTSGMVHSKNVELEQMVEQAVDRLAELRSKFSKDIQAAQMLVQDLDWAQKRITYLSRKAKSRFPIEYTELSERYKI